MRSAHRVALLLVFGCSQMQARSDARAPQEPLARAAASAPRLDALPWLESARSFPKANAEAFVSAHFGHAFAADVRVNPEARTAYLALVSDVRFDDGTWFVEMLSDAKTHRAGPTLALERAHGAWRYWLLDANGAASRAKLEFCAACHSAAPAAPIFGLPREPLPSVVEQKKPANEAVRN